MQSLKWWKKPEVIEQTTMLQYSNISGLQKFACLAPRIIKTDFKPKRNFTKICIFFSSEIYKNSHVDSKPPPLRFKVLCFFQNLLLPFQREKSLSRRYCNINHWQISGKRDGYDVTIAVHFHQPHRAVLGDETRVRNIKGEKEFCLIKSVGASLQKFAIYERKWYFRFGARKIQY